MENVSNAPVKSASQLKIEVKILAYQDLQKTRVLTTNELKMYANAKAKIDNRSASRIYREVTELKDLPQLLGTSPVPSFKDFADKLPNKSLFSLWDGLTVIVKFNKQAQVATKIQKQGGEVGAKAEVQTPKTKATKKVVEILEAMPA